MARQSSYILPDHVRSVGLIGTGSIGSGWATLCLARGLSVIAHDSAPGAEERTREFISAAWPAVLELGVAKTPEPALSNLRFVDSIAAVCEASDVVQENAPEKLELKLQILAEIDRSASSDKIVISSTGGIPPSRLQAAFECPGRFVVGHPFHPLHLIPLVEVVPGTMTSPETVQWALDFYSFLGKKPIKVNIEASGHMTNRLQFALVREAVHCLLEGMASAKDIDLAVQYGLGPRWALMGSLLTLHLAGGGGGMKGILDKAGPAIEEWWTPAGQLHLTDEVKALMVAASEQISNEAPIDAWVGWRDGLLVDVIKLQMRSETSAPNAGR